MIDLGSVPAAGWAAMATVVGSLAGWLTTRNKSGAEVSAVLSDTSLEWIHELRDEADRLRDRLEETEGALEHEKLDNTFMRRRCNDLSAALRIEGVDPATVRTNGPFMPPGDS